MLLHFESYLELVCKILIVTRVCVLNFQVRLNEAVEAAALFEPHVVLTVDSKGFSFRFLKQLRGIATNEPTLLENLLCICYLENAICS